MEQKGFYGAALEVYATFKMLACLTLEPGDTDAKETHFASNLQKGDLDAAKKQLTEILNDSRVRLAKREDSDDRERYETCNAMLPNFDAAYKTATGILKPLVGEGMEDLGKLRDPIYPKRT